MKIAIVASEAAPFMKTGGLGDVIEALPKALSDIPKTEISVFIPFYPKIKYDDSLDIEFIESFSVNLSWRKQHVGVFKLKSRKKKLKFYFIDNEYYFGRDKAYGYMDDGERFAYFSMAVLETMARLNLRFDVIHCHDWQTALVPVYLREFYQECLGNSKTVFTIHNIEYQGKADSYYLGDMLGLGNHMLATMSYDKCINFMKAAILKSDAVTTVSETYAKEILYPYYSHGLDPILRDHAFKLSGIVNGISDSVNPEVDKALIKSYNIESFEMGKKANRDALLKELNLKEAGEHTAVIGMVTRLVSHKGMDILCSVIDELMSFDIRLVIVGTGDSIYERRLSQCAGLNGDKFSMNLKFDSGLASKIYAASDMYLMPSKSEPCGLSQLIAMRYGTIPIVHKTGGLSDTVQPFNAQTNEGCGFNFQSFNAGDMLDAIRRSLTLFGTDREKWNILVKNAMSYNSSWDKPAEKYLELYNKVAQK